MGSLVTYRRDEHAVRLDMDDGKLNVLSTPMLTELHEAFERASAEGVPVVLSGREGALSAGFDLNVLRGGGTAAAELLQAGFTLAYKMLSFPTPVVVACTGHAIAMGLFIVLSGDYRIGAAGPFRLTANEVAIGMTLPRTPVEVCRHRLVPGYFDRVVILAEVFSPDAAAPAGILDRVVPPDEMDSAVSEILGALGTLDMEAHRATKLRAREGLLRAIEEAIAADDAEFRASIGAPTS
jgi:enoyl-CoA hydratase